MKFILLLIISFSFLSCNRDELSKINVTSENNEIDFFIIVRPIDDLTLWGEKKDTVFRNKEDLLLFETVLQEPEIVTVVFDKGRWAQLVLQPNKSYEIQLTDSTLSFVGENSKGIEFFNQLNRQFFNFNDKKFINDSTGNLLSRKVELLKNEELFELDKLFQEKEIDTTQYNVIKKDIDYYYANVILNVIFSKHYIGELVVTKEVDYLINETIEKYPIEIENRPVNWKQYVETCVIRRDKYNKITKGEATYDAYQKLWEEDKLFSHEIDIIKSNLSGRHLEKFWAHYLMFSTGQMHFERSLISIFDDYKMIFPESPYTKYIQPEINDIIVYHQNSSKDLADNAIVVDEDITSFEELISKFAGEKLYVDVWASWCGPCKIEFEHNNGIEALLKQNGYHKLFISMDELEKKSKWLEMIKHYDLAGYHFLANDDFQTDFYETGIYQGSLPQYLLVNANGQVINKDAPRPSQNKELANVISK